MTAPSTGARVRKIVTPWRIGYTVALGAAAVAMTIGFQSSKDEHKINCSGGPVVRLLPCPGDTDLSQGQVGVVLTTGYKAVLVVDSVEIPQDQLHTGGDNQIYFQPGPNTETGSLTPGPHAATVIYWPVTSDRDHGVSFRWSFTTQ